MTVTDGPETDRDALRGKYGEERDKRLRPDGNDQYLEPPASSRTSRRPVHASGSSASRCSTR